MLNPRGVRGGMRVRGMFRGRGRQPMRRRGGGRGGGRGGANAVSKKKDPCSVYISFINPIEAVCAKELLQVAKDNGASVKFGRHCYLTFSTESEAKATLTKASDVEFGGQKAYVDNAFKSQNSKAGKREAEVNVQSSPTKKMKGSTGGAVEKEGEEEVETMEEEEGGKVEEEEEEEEMGENYTEDTA